MLEKCELCPFKCKVNRKEGILGKCRAGKDLKIGLYSLHFDEEPCISGNSGSGTVFFSNCNLKCVFCQNYEISSKEYGEIITVERLAEIFLELQNKNANNINLVTPTPYIYQIIEAIKIAKERGLKIPILYNTSGYENVKTLKLLEGYIDIYLPDFKYADNDLAKRLSKTDRYFEIVTEAVKEMYRQVGVPKLDKNGIIQKGLIIRHLILPNHVDNTKKVLKWIDENLDREIYVSIMAQYFPCFKAKENSDINRKISKYEYEEVEKFLYSLDIENGYMQDFEPNEDEEKYVPKFNNDI